MTDFGYPNDDAVKATGVFNQHDSDTGSPPGWTDAVVGKIKAEIEKEHQGDHGDYTGPDYDHSKFSAEENAAYQWYKDDVIEQSHWEQIVKNYEANGGSKAPTQPDVKDYNPDDDYIPKKDSGFQPPSVNEYHGPDNKSHTLSVSTEAIEYFINELKSVADDGTGILLDARGDLNKLDVKPGGFARAELMRQKVMGSQGGDPGLRGDTMDMLTTIHSALFNMQTDLQKMLKEYQSTEDFNTMTADQFGDVMGDAWGKVGNLSQYGKSDSSGSGSGSDGDKDS
jgi:hypothetical protein